MAKGSGGGFFRMDGPFIRYGNLPPIVVWPLIFLMIIHWGPASTAMYYTMGKKQRGTDSYTFHDYWTSYKREYKQALLVAAIITALVGLVIYNIWFMYINSGSFGAMVSIETPMPHSLFPGSSELGFSFILAGFGTSLFFGKVLFFCQNGHFYWTLSGHSEQLRHSNPGHFAFICV